MSGIWLAINQDKGHSSRFMGRGMQEIRTPSTWNTANFQGGLLSAQLVLHEEDHERHRAAGNGENQVDWGARSRAAI